MPTEWEIRFETLNRLWEANAPVGAIVECIGQDNPKRGQSGLVVNSTYNRIKAWRGVVIVWPPHHTGVSYSSSSRPTDWKILEPPDDETRALAGFLRYEHNYKIPFAELSRQTTIGVEKIKVLPWRVLSRLCCAIGTELKEARRLCRYFPLGIRVKATDSSHPHANHIGKVFRHEPEALRCIVAWEDGEDTAEHYPLSHLNPLSKERTYTGKTGTGTWVRRLFSSRGHTNEVGQIVFPGSIFPTIRWSDGSQTRGSPNMRNYLVLQPSASPPVLRVAYRPREEILIPRRQRFLALIGEAETP